MYGPKGWTFTEACFRNPSLPYCAQRDFVIKAGKGKGNEVAPPSTGKPTKDAAGIDWRFADPYADTVAVLDSNKLPAAALARSLINQLAANQGLNATEAQSVFRALSAVNQVALSVRDEKIVILVTGRPADAILPALERDWKAVTLGGDALLIGNSSAVEQASQRLTMDIGLGDLPLAAQHRTGGSEFWMAGSAELAGQEAMSAGVKRFELMASMHDGLASDTVFEFDGAPDANAIQSWLGTLGGARLDGTAVHMTMSMNAEDTRQNLSKIAVSSLGQHLGTIVKSARYIPVRDTSATVHTKPVIYGLDGGPQEGR